MLLRKIENKIEEHFKSESDKILVIDGARQIGKTYIIRYVGKKLFKNYIEINMLGDFDGARQFENVRTVQDFYFQLSTLFGDKMGDKKDTLVFIDEIQAYPHLLTMLKFLRTDNRFTYIASGSLLGVTLSVTTSIPMGSIEMVRMYPLDFEEFLIANGYNDYALNILRERFEKRETLDEASHKRLLSLFKYYLIVGGLPDAVNAFIAERNIVKIRKVQRDTHAYYAADASKYDTEKKLAIRRIYEILPSNLENKKKRIVYKDIENKKGKTYENYAAEFEYLVSSGIALDVNAVSTPNFPLITSVKRSLLKLYMNDVGILSGILFADNPNAILDDVKSINLGTLYENLVASELKAHGYDLYYYDNKDKGEVDFLIDDFKDMSVLPIEVKSGKDYTIHHALNTFLANPDYNVKSGVVLSNERKIYTDERNVTYMPIYFIMFFKKGDISVSELKTDF